MRSDDASIRVRGAVDLAKRSGRFGKEVRTIRLRGRFDLIVEGCFAGTGCGFVYNIV